MKIEITEQQLERINESLLNEGGIRDINKLAQRYPKAEIYFHQDLDGVVSALGMKNYLENYGIEVIGSHVIQYGDKEFSVKKPDASGDVMPVLVDFAHGKPIFKIHTDHHDSQAGVEDDTATQFRGARSNVETISQTISPSDIFSNEDIMMINTVNSYAKEKGFASPEDMAQNQAGYIESQKKSNNLKLEGNIIVQYGGGALFKPGSYDRYTPFKIYPEADFLVIAWPMGLVQASCNPFKKDRALKGVNLGDIAQEVLKTIEPQLKAHMVPISVIKRVGETKADDDSIGFKTSDLFALYKDHLQNMPKESSEYYNMAVNIIDSPWDSLSEKQKTVLDNIKVPAWDVIQANSGGHKCITNLSGLNFFSRATRNPEKGTWKKKSDSKPTRYVEFVKWVQKELVSKIKSSINQ